MNKRPVTLTHDNACAMVIALEVGLVNPGASADIFRRVKTALQEAIVKAEARPRPVILCSAIYYDDGIERPHQPPNVKTGIVVCGLRHCNCLVILAALFPNGEYKGGKVRRYWDGFLTSEGNFVDRVEGAVIALRAGQIDKLKFCDERLYSEDLW